MGLLEAACFPHAAGMRARRRRLLKRLRLELAEAALDLFVDLYGSWVGNVALLLQPRGGLYVAGGIAVHLQARMQSPRFMAAAGDKGRMRGVVERTPVLLVTNSRLGVQGAIATGFAMS